MQNRPGINFCYLMLLVIFIAIIPSKCLSQIPDTLEGKVEMLGENVQENQVTKDYFLSLGPDVVPIVTEKLLKILAEGTSHEWGNEDAIINMPKEDQKRVRRQIGLLAMQEAALQNMALDPSVRQSAVASVNQALKSPYQVARRAAVYSAANGIGKDSIDAILGILNDEKMSNRVIAAQVLSKIGDESTAKKISAILDQRGKGLTPEQIQKDASFRHGYDAINTLTNKGNDAQSIDSSLTEKKSLSPNAIIEPGGEISIFPSLPVTVGALVLAIFVAVFFMLRRK